MGPCPQTSRSPPPAESVNGIALSPIVAHLRELLRHINTTSVDPAKDVLLLAASRVVNASLEDEHFSFASGWTCKWCGSRNDEEEECCFVCDECRSSACSSDAT